MGSDFVIHMDFDTVVFERLRRGHREAYTEYFSREIKDSHALFGFSLRNIWKLIKANRVVFSTADDYFVFYIGLSFIRVLMRKPSLGILIRAELCLDSSDGKFYLKKCLLWIQKRLGVGRSVSIMPFFVEPRLEVYVSDWIYDPAFFSGNKVSSVLQSDNELNLIHNIKKEKLKGKRIVLFLGVLSEERGIREFIQLALDNASLQDEVVYVACGLKSENIPDNLVDAFTHAGGVFYYGRLSEHVFEELIDMADYLWCVFSSKYDQFSGVFCNALSKGVSVLVRKNSRLHKFSVSKCIGDQALVVNTKSRLDERLDSCDRVLISDVVVNLESMKNHNSLSIKKTLYI